MTSAEKATTKPEGEQKLSAPSISLPKGGGAIRGMGEKFASNPVTGTGAMSVPIATSPGRSGFGSQLSLSYDSGSGNGPFGFGWSLSLPAITRKTDKGLPQYQDEQEPDVCVLSGAEDLVPVLNVDGTRFRDDTSAPGFVIHRYRPRIEGLFARIERWTNVGTGEIHWRSITRDNVTTLYGKDNNSRIFDPADPSPAHPTRIFSWLICESYDDKGNAIVYKYAVEDDREVDRTQVNERNRVRMANRYLKRIKYGNTTPNRDADWNATDPTALSEWLFEVVFDYGEHDVDAPTPNDAGAWGCRPDPFSSYRSGFEVRTYRLCQRVLMFHHFPGEAAVGRNCLVRSTDFAYRYEGAQHDPENPIYSFLLAVTQNGYKRQDGGYLRRSLPPLEFEYSRVPTQAELDDLPVETLDRESLRNLPVGLNNGYQWVDLDGEGISGILTEQAGAWFYKPNLGDGRFGPLQAVAAKPSLAALNGGRQQLLDLAGDGQLDLAEFAGPTPGFYERTHDEGWAPFRAFESLPAINWADPNLRFVDLTGDGHADILITENSVFTWHLSLAEAGFDRAARVQQALDEERGPHLVFADGSQTIFLSDMSGDGLVDLARIRNGEVCYWPNLGYGRFGAKVTMDDAPWFETPDLFDPQRIRLADVDGSGTTDILYLGRDRIEIYRNESGNGWAQPVHRSHFPRIDNLSDVAVVDLTGNGTACLVWSSPLARDARQPLCYIDLMAGQKPHLLVCTRNNLGAETRVDYASSTKFYLADKRDGTPWITKLPFPMHVVERVETHDRISGNRFVTRYAYHHGYYDGIEREFRGFGRVDQRDTEEYAALEAGGELEGTTNWDESSHVPPVLTKTWFHTGAYLDDARISTHFADEYYHEGDASLGESDLSPEQLAAMRLPDTVLPASILLPGGDHRVWTLSADEERQASRALKGSILRQEVYALDGSEAEDRPYTVSESNYTVEMLQPQGANQHAVFFTHAREAINFHYERELYKVEDRAERPTVVDPEEASPAALDLTDPRVTHAMTLAVDEYGNVLRAVAIGYGRRYRFDDPSLDSGVLAEVHARQQKTLLTYSENRYTNAVLEPDAYRTPLPREARTYELVNVTPETHEEYVTNLFTLDEMADNIQEIIDAGRDIPYADVEAAGAAPDQTYRRLVEQARTLYRSDDFSRLLEPGELEPRELESLALPGESYQLAFTPDLLERIYQRGGENLLPDRADLLGGTASDQGGYVDLDGDGNWWIPSGRIFYHPNTTPPADPAEERDEARAHFFLPRRFQDPFGHNTVVTYDHDLLVLETQDALGNRVTAVNDYRVLQPALVTDPNGNRAAVAFDALGLVAATAVMGKEHEGLGDLLDDDYRTDVTEVERNDFFAAPRGPMAATLLGTATTRIIYDLDRYLKDGAPAVAATLARETHVHDPLPPDGLRVQVNLAYSDGFGRVIQQKAQAEPGPVPQRDPATGQVIVDARRQPVMTADDFEPRWVASGWTVFNNKGKPVRQYEPFFTDRHDFEFDVRIGVSPVLCYDPVGRVVATLHPNHTYEKVVFDPWQQASWDVNDTVTSDPSTDPDVGGFFTRLPHADYLPTWYQQRITLPEHDPERVAADKAAMHADTPTRVCFDTLGRPVVSVAHNKFEREDRSTDLSEIVEEFYPTRTELDIEGQSLRIIDARGNEVMTYMVRDASGRMTTGYDLAGRLLYQKSMDAGERWMLANAAGNPIRRWDSRGFTRRLAYDELQRPTHLWVQEGTDPAWLAERIVYGERYDEAPRNLRAKPYQQFDGAGVVTNEAYDFKGNLLRGRRRLANNYKTAVGWPDIDPFLRAGPDETLDLDAIEQAVAPLLESETFESSTVYDALNRPIQQVTPHHVTPHANPVLPNVIQPRYNEANLLESIAVWLRRDAAPDRLLDPDTADQKPVTDIDYNAKGQRTEIAYGNGVVTGYTYDWETFRLTHLLTKRRLADYPDDCPHPPLPDWPGCQVQNLRYTYDPAGNITRIRDDAQQTIFFRNQRVEPSAAYTYDALYRLIGAVGREHLGQNPTSGALNPPVRPSHTDAPRVGLDHPSNGEAMGNYTEWYEYDGVGNILAMRHQADSGAWRRCYQYALDSNRLLSTSGPGQHQDLTRRCPTPYADIPVYAERYAYDAHGSMTSMPHLPDMQWDFKDQLHEVNLGGGGTAFYVYDAAGQRVRKVHEHNGATVEERIYLGGFEIYRRRNGSGLTLARETLHIMDGQQRVVLIETKTVEANVATLTPTPLLRYQLSNHLGSACVELAEDASMISFEEYYPYGSTSYQAVHGDVEVPTRRYRYTGMERDEETRLGYHKTRFYAPWLGKWTSCDPWTWRSPERSSYNAMGNNPTCHVDLNGKLDIPAGEICTQPYLGGTMSEEEFDACIRMQGQSNAAAVLVGIVFFAGVEFGPAFLIWALENPHLTYAGTTFGIGLVDPHPPGGSPLDPPGPFDQAGRGVGSAIRALDDVTESAARLAPEAVEAGARAADEAIESARVAEGLVAPEAARVAAGGGEAAAGFTNIGIQFGARATREIGHSAQAIPGRLRTYAVSLERLQEIGEGVWRNARMLHRLQEIRGLQGDDLVEAVDQILRDWHRQSGMGIEIVPRGTVSRAVGSRDFASLQTRPGYLQIEAQVSGNARQYFGEVVHELSAYYAWRFRGQIGESVPAFQAGGQGTSLLDFLEQRVVPLTE